MPTATTIVRGIHARTTVIGTIQNKNVYAMTVMWEMRALGVIRARLGLCQWKISAKNVRQVPLPTSTE